MQIQHSKTDGKGMFFVGEAGSIVAEMTYAITSPDKLIIDHTEVDDSLQGKGVGLQLLENLVDYARSHNFKVIPQCSFAKSMFDKKPELRDVLD